MARGSRSGGKAEASVVSRYDDDPPRALIIYVPLTTQNRESPYEVPIPKQRFLDRDSVANVQGIGSLPKVRLERKLGGLPDAVMSEIKHALSFALELAPKADHRSQTLRETTCDCSSQAASRSRARAACACALTGPERSREGKT